jgi:hypothetical protein
MVRAPLGCARLEMKQSPLHRQFLDDYDRDRTHLKASLTKADRRLLVHLREVSQLVKDSFVSLLCQKETFHRISAFALYGIESIYLLQRTCTEALCCYYGVGTVMLRSGLEALIRGAFWEGMAHKAFRDRAEVVRRVGGVKINGELRKLHRWFADVFARAPQAETDFEVMSAAIFDRTSALFSEPELNRVLPPFIAMVEQVAQWELLDPIPEPARAIYRGVYRDLSSAVHLIPDKTLLGRRFVAGKPAFPTIEFSADDLKAFVDMLEIVANVGMVLSLNLTAKILPGKGLVESQFDALGVRMRQVLPRGFCGDWKSQ